MASELVTREYLGRKLGLDPRTIEKRHAKVADLVFGENKRVPLYANPFPKEKKN